MAVYTAQWRRRGVGQQTPDLGIELFLLFSWLLAFRLFCFCQMLNSLSSPGEELSAHPPIKDQHPVISPGAYPGFEMAFMQTT